MVQKVNLSLNVGSTKKEETPKQKLCRLRKELEETPPGPRADKIEAEIKKLETEYPQFKKNPTIWDQYEGQRKEQERKTHPAGQLPSVFKQK